MSSLPRVEWATGSSIFDFVFPVTFWLYFWDSSSSTAVLRRFLGDVNGDELGKERRAGQTVETRKTREGEIESRMSGKVELGDNEGLIAIAFYSSVLGRLASRRFKRARIYRRRDAFMSTPPSFHSSPIGERRTHSDFLCSSSRGCWQPSHHLSLFRPFDIYTLIARASISAMGENVLLSGRQISISAYDTQKRRMDPIEKKIDLIVLRSKETG